MNNVSAFSLFLATYGSSILAATVLAAIAGLYGLRKSGSPSIESEMRYRLVFNVVFFLLAWAFLYQGMKIANVHKVLVEMNTGYYEGSRSDPVAPAEELKALETLANRALINSLFAFLTLVSSAALQYLRARRHRRRPSPIEAPPPTSNASSTPRPSASL